VKGKGELQCILLFDVYIEDVYSSCIASNGFFTWPYVPSPPSAGIIYSFDVGIVDAIDLFEVYSTYEIFDDCLVFLIMVATTILR